MWWSVWWSVWWWSPSGRVTSLSFRMSARERQCCKRENRLINCARFQSFIRTCFGTFFGVENYTYLMYPNLTYTFIISICLTIRWMDFSLLGFVLYLWVPHSEKIVCHPVTLITPRGQPDHAAADVCSAAGCEIQKCAALLQYWVVTHYLVARSV